MDPRHDALYLSKDVDGMYYEIRRQRAEIEQLRRSMGRCSEGSDMTTDTAALVRRPNPDADAALRYGSALRWWWVRMFSAARRGEQFADRRPEPGDFDRRNHG